MHANHLIFKECEGIAQEVTASSLHRQRRGEQIVAGASDYLNPMTVLGDETDPELPICRKRMNASDAGYTLASAVFRISNGVVDWHVHGHPCEAPVLAGSVKHEHDSFSLQT